MIYGFRKQFGNAARGMCMLALAGIAFDCINKPLAPVAPTWETHMTVPVSARTYTLADIVAKDSTLIGVAPLPVISGQMQVSFPPTLSLNGGLFCDTASIGDTSGSGQGHTFVDEKTAADFNRILVHVGIDNAIPLQVVLKLHLLDRAHRLLLSLPQSAGDSINIPAPVLAGGGVQSPTHAERALSLEGGEVRQFNNAYSLAYVLDVSAPSADVLRFESTQTIQIRVWAEFYYQVNK